MMIDTNIPISFWAEMINTASYLRQRSPTIALENRTPRGVLHRAIAGASGSGSDPRRDCAPPVGRLCRIGCAA